LTGVFTHPP